LTIAAFPSPEDFTDDGVAVGGGEAPSEDAGSAPTEDVTSATADVPSTEESGETESTETPENNVLSLDEYGDRMITVKVDGEEITVPLAEAAQGYQRQADYTQKTQTLAEKAKKAEAFEALQARLAANPQEVLTALAERYGQPATSTLEATATDAGEQVDPQLLALNERIAHFEQQEQDRLLEETLSGIEALDPQFNRDEFVREAVDAGIKDISQLEGFYKIQAFDRVMGGQLANTQKAADDATDDAQRQAAAAAASAAQHGAESVAGGDSAPTTFDSFEAAWDSAIAAHGDPWA
jgi:hypothetical protein